MRRHNNEFFSTGRGLGGLLSSFAVHHFGLIRAFIGAALISLFVGAVWFLWIHLKSPCQSSRRKNLNTADTSSQFPKGISILLFLCLLSCLLAHEGTSKLSRVVHSCRRGFLAPNRNVKENESLERYST